MANLLSITKEDNEQFSFVINGDTATEIINTRNDLLTIGNETHFKTANGANLVKDQSIIFSNVSLFDGVTPVASPTSTRDLFDKLTALGFFDWIDGTGGSGGVDRFDDLLDTFKYFGKDGQFLVVDESQLKLVTVAVTIVTESTQLTDMPSVLSPGLVLKVNDAGTAYILTEVLNYVSQSIDPLVTDKAPSEKAVYDALSLKANISDLNKPYIKYADDYANLTDAINATPQGGTLILGNTSYTGKISITRDNINIIGSKMPGFHATLDQLSGGTIINGSFVIDGNNISIRNLGIDSGTAQCVALNSGSPMEGLIMHDIGASVLNFNNTVENVIAIVKANTTMHALLFEGLANSTFRNVHGKGGDFGVVFKVSDSNATDIFGYESRTTNVYIKSDSYAPCLRSNFNNINSLSSVIIGTQPVAIHASTSNMFDINVSNINIYGGDRQLRLIASPSVTPTYVMSNINVSGAVMEEGVSVGVDTYGVIYNSTINNILIRNTNSGQGLYSDGSSRGINFNNIRFDDDSGNALDTAIDFRGYCVLNNIVSVRNSDQTNLGGINLNNFAVNAKIGIYVGNLKIGGVSVNKDKLTGQGTVNYLSKYDTSGTLKNSLIFDDGLNAAYNGASYSLGAGWSFFGVNNSTGSGFLTQVNNVPALRTSSNSTGSVLNELRNLALNLAANGVIGATIHPSKGFSIGSTVDPGANNLSVVGNITAANLISGTYTPTFTAIANCSGLSGSATYIRNGNIVILYVRFSITETLASTATSFRITLPVNRTNSTTVFSIGTGHVRETIAATDKLSRADFDTANNSTAVITYRSGTSAGGVTGGITIQYSVLD